MPDASRVDRHRARGRGRAAGARLGAAWSGNWETVLLFFNGEEWGDTDPTLGRDIGFYVFDLPFWRFLLGWASTTLIIVGLLTLATYAARALRWQFHLSAPVRAHLSVIGALLLVVIAAGYQLDIAELAYSVGGPDDSVQAALYTDMNAQLPAYVILTVVALVAAAMLLLNTWFRTLWLLALAAGAWFLLSIARRRPVPDLRAGGAGQAERAQRGAAVPRQPHRGDPRGLRPRRDRAAPVHRRAGADARGLRGGRGHHRQPAAVGLPAAAHDVRPGADPAALLRLPRRRHRSLRDRRRAAPDHAQRARARRRAARPTTPDLDQRAPGLHPRLRHHRRAGRRGDRRRARPTTSSAASTASRSCRSASRASTSARRPTPTSSPAPPPTSSTIRSTPRRAARPRPAPPPPGTARPASASATSLTRALFALRFGDFNLLISGQLTDDSQILFRRDIEERVREIAPFLAYDGDPYLVSADGPAAVGVGRLHRHRSLPERAAAADDEPRSPARTTSATASRSSSTPTTAPSASSWPIPTSRSSPPTRGSSPACSSRLARCPRSWWPTCAIPRTCSPRRTRRTASTTCRRPRAAPRPTTTRTTAGPSPRTSRRLG